MVDRLADRLKDLECELETGHYGDHWQPVDGGSRTWPAMEQWRVEHQAKKADDPVLPLVIGNEVTFKLSPNGLVWRVPRVDSSDGKVDLISLTSPPGPLQGISQRLMLDETS